MKLNKTLIRKTMLTFIRECRDNKTGELNHTKLAELTADTLGIYVNDTTYEIPIELFDLALEHD